MTTITEASKALNAGQVTARTLTQQALAAIKQHDATLHAFLHVDEEGALAAADESDARRREGKSLGPLDGISISFKDNIVTTELPSTAGDRMLEGYVSPYDATVVTRLKAAGAIIIGKTNCDAWGHGSSTENSAYSSTKNPWDTDRVPGGSSGGSAVAVMTGMSLGSVGTDTGGSIRQPASLTGATGFKPTYGRLSRYGLIAMASSLDCHGPLARSAEDCALLFDAMKGQDPLDATSLPDQASAIRHQSSDADKPLAGKKIGVPKEYFGEGLDSAVAKLVKEALAVYEQLGATLVDIELPMTKYAIAAYYIIMPAEVSSNLGRYDGIRYGKSVISTQASGIKTADELIRKNRTAGFGPEAKRRIMLGTYVLSSGYYDAYYKRAMQVRTKVIDEFRAAFAGVDLIAGPTTPTAAFKLGEKSGDPLAMYLEDVFTVSANLAGLPAISIPCGFVELKNEESRSENREDQALNSQFPIPNSVKKLPIGLQLLGPQLGDEDVLAAAMAYQQQTNWHLQEPPTMGSHDE